jgi:hypothetical protein
MTLTACRREHELVLRCGVAPLAEFDHHALGLPAARPRSDPEDAVSRQRLKRGPFPSPYLPATRTLASASRLNH